MRNIINLNGEWKFSKENKKLPEVMPEGWESVELPHTWNAVDGHDGNGSYDRGCYWYARTFETPRQPLKGGRIFLEILVQDSRPPCM